MQVNLLCITVQILPTVTSESTQKLHNTED
jgi:hypothetical protein